MSVQSRLQFCQKQITTLLIRYLPDKDRSSLNAAMHYACLNGGKRLRPLLVYLIAELFETPSEKLDPIALAIELIHCYSLVHDDLPAMDNDDMRRGKPTCHKVYGEAHAILAGNALLTLAYEILATAPYASSLIQIISEAIGHNGMMHGQALDMVYANQPCSLPQLIEIHLAKTGALIAATISSAAVATGCATPIQTQQLKTFGLNMGLAFQIQDDILDGEKFVSLLGLEKAREQAIYYRDQALSALTPFDHKADGLRDLTHFMIERVT